MKTLVKLCLLLAALAGTSLHAQTGAISWQCIDQFGQPLPHCQVRVCSVTSTGTPCTPTVPIYQDYNLTTPISNPYAGDQYGNFSFYVPALTFPNIYLIQLSPASGITWSYLINGPGGTGGSGCITSGAVGVLVASNGSGGCSDAFVQVNGVNLATPTPVNFIDSATVLVTNPGTGQIQFQANPTLAIDTNTIPNTSQTVLSFTDTATIHFANPSGGVETATCVTGTSTLLGCMKPDNVTIGVSSGTLTVPTATTVSLGIVRPDNTSITISNGVLSAAPSSSLIVKVEGSTTGVNQGTIDFNSTLPAAPGAGFVNCTWQNDTATGEKSCYVPASTASLSMNTGLPPGVRQVAIYPTGFTTFTIPAGTATATNTNGVVTATTQCAGSESAQITWTYTGALAAQVPWLNPANVVAVSGFSYVSVSAISSGFNCGTHPFPPFQVGAVNVITNSVSLFTTGVQAPLQFVSQPTSLTGATLESTTTVASIGVSGSNSGNTTASFPLVGLILTYVSDPLPPADNSVRVDAPLIYTTVNGYPELKLDPRYPTLLHTYTVAGGLPAAAASLGTFIGVTDSTDCVTSTGSINNTLCGPVVLPGDVFAWAPISGGTGGSGISGGVAGQLAIFGTATTITSGIAIGNTGSDIPQLSGGLLSASILPLGSSSAFGAVKVDGTTITASGGVISAASGVVASVSGTSPIVVSPTVGAVIVSCPTCSVGSGTSVSINGGGALGTLNLNGTTPAAGTNGLNVTWQVSGSNASAEVVGDGNSAHFLNGIGTYTTPAGGATVASAEVVAFSATPTFSVSFNTSRIVLTGNITTFTLGAGSDGQDKTLCFKQGAGPYTVAGPANVHGLFTVGVTNGVWNCQSFNYDNTDSIWLATTTGVINE